MGPIEEIQRCLQYLSQYMPEIPAVSPNGKYDGMTAEAVAVFQWLHRLPITGEVDFVTWNKIMEVYRVHHTYCAEPLPLPILRESDTPVKIGSVGDCVYGTQLTLQQFHQKHGFPAISITGEYDAATKTAVEQFQKSASLPVTGEMDLHTWNHLALFYKKTRCL